MTEMKDLPAKYNMTDAAIAEMTKKYSGMTITERITALLAPIEDELKATKKTEDDRKSAIKAEKDRIEQERVDTIQAKIRVMQGLSVVSPAMTSKEINERIKAAATTTIDESCQEFRDHADTIKSQALEALGKALEDRLAWEKQETERKKEGERLEVIRIEQEKKDAEQKAAQDKIDAENQRISDEKQKLEDDKKAEADRKEREAFERQAKEDARIQAEKDAKDKAELEERERLEKEDAAKEEAERQEALKPDKEKLLAFVLMLLKLDIPDLGSSRAKDLVNAAMDDIINIADKLKRDAEKL